jgi:hypothetical protein
LAAAIARRPHEHAAVEECAALEQELAEPGSVRGAVRIGTQVVPALIDPVALRAHHDALGMLGHELQLAFETLGLGDVIRVVACDERGAAERETFVQGARVTTARLVPDDAHARVAERAKVLRSLVQRAVVDDQEVEVAECLGQDALHGIG